MNANRIDVSGIREHVTRTVLAGFTAAGDGVEVRRAATPKISKVPAVRGLRRSATSKISKNPGAALQ